MSTLRVDHVVVGGGLAGLWLAQTLLSRGRTVAVVERGARRLDAEAPASPALRFPQRPNIGATQARHHVLTGNGSYWGGGLVRNDDDSLRRMFDLPADAGAVRGLVAAYDAIERRLGAPPAGRFAAGSEGDPVRVCEVNVLPGRRRNLGRTVLTLCLRDPGFHLLCPARVVHLEIDSANRVEAVIVLADDGSSLELRAEHVVLAMGVVDTNLFAQAHLAALVDGPSVRIGTRLHDHWSLPIAKLRWKGRAGLDWLYPPTFRGGCVQGRRVELEARLPWGVHAGFLHIQAHYDEIEPYATIKRWMSARQEGRGWGHQAGFLGPLLRHGGRLGRIGWSRYVERQLFVPDGTPLDVVLDFESCAAGENRLTHEDGEHRMYWDVREQDVAAFAALASRALRLASDWAGAASVELEASTPPDDPGALESYLRAHAVDAYHLGGGLAVGADPGRAALAPDFRFHGVRNLGVISTAAFARPGLANPVETLLAMCERYAATLA